MVKITQMRKMALRQAAFRLAIVAFALLAPLGLRAQEIVTIGTGTSTDYYTPIGTYYNYSITEQLYTAEEIGMAGTITSISFSYASSTAKNLPITVYMMHTNAADLSTGISLADADIVFDGTYSVTGAGWMTIELNTPFEYDGTSNLLIGINKDYLYYYNGNTWNHTTTSAVMARYTQNDNNAYTTSTIPGTTRTARPNIQLTIEPAQQGGDVCDKPATCDFSNVTATSATLTWTGGSGTYNVEVKGGEWADWTAILSNTTNTTTTLTLQPTTSYQARVQSVCDGSTPTSGWKTATSITTPCASYDIPYTYGFEDAAPFDCWTVISGNITRQGTPTHDGSYRLDFRGTTSNMVALPNFNAATNTLRVEFWTRPESTGGSSGKFAIGYMTDVTDASTFVAVETYNSTEMTTTYVKKTVDMANVPAGATIAMRQFECSTNYYWYVDDVTVKEIPSCVAPTALAANATTTSANLSWTANSSETAWTVYYKKTTDENYTEVANATNPYTLNGLTASTNYQYYVVANCSSTDASEASEVFNFATACEAVTTFPWSENLESHTGVTSGTTNNLPICWNYINTCTYSSFKGYPVIYNYSSYSTSGNNHLRFYSYYSTYSNYDPQPQYAILPEMNGLDGKQISLFARGYNTSSTLKVGRMTDPTDASTFVLCQELTLTTSYQEFEVELTGTGNYIALMIDAATSTRTSNSVYVDDITVETIPTCRKPSALMLNTPSGAVTAHTATLKWTNGAEGQNAWQIAYKAGSNFDPNDAEALATATIVDVTTNPATIDLPTASTTYYAYVRANCGDDGYSAWSVANATFTTLTGTAVPTGLAVEQSTITSNTATASWTGVATNDYHASYDLYWATSDVASVPDEPAAPNFVAGITATSYQITDLTPETEYKVWVRDNCGTDGYSAWTSAVTFATAADCQSPDGLAAANITAHTADITWNTYGQTGFNLRYKKSTDEAWTDVPDAGTSYQMTHLDPVTTYQVEVQATCNTEVWSTTYDFTTDIACHAPTDLAVTNGSVTAHGATITWQGTSESYNVSITKAIVSSVSADFEDQTIPSTWTNDATYPWVITAAAAAEGSSYSIKSGNTGVNNSTSSIEISVTFSSDATIEFDARCSSEQDVESYDWDYGTFYIDDIQQGSKIINSTTFNHYAYDVTPGTHTLKWRYKKDGSVGSNDDCLYVDNISVTAITPGTWTENSTNEQTYTFDNLDPDAIYLVKVQGDCGTEDGLSEWTDLASFNTPIACPAPTALANATPGTHSVALTWTKNGTADDWQLCINDDEANLIIPAEADVTTTGTTVAYTLTGLTPETDYSVKVRANCGNEDGQSVWSNVINFTTDIACHKPTNLALVEEEGNPTQTTAKLSWTENGIASAWTIAYKAEGADEFIERMIINDPTTTLNNLTQGTNYTVKVRAICGGDYGNSQWSDEFYFQTVASCPAPENLAVTANSETAHGATITWDGEADSYNIEYAEGPLAGLATLLDEGFEGGSMPTGWTSEGDRNWIIGTGDFSVSTTHNGSYNAKPEGSSGGNGDEAYLVTPAMDLSNYENAKLTCWYMNRDWAGDTDGFGVYYRTSSNGAWQQLFSTEVSHTSWTQTAELALPSESYVQIGFNYTDNYGYGVGLDDIKITAEYTPTYSWNTLVSGITEEEYVITELDPQTDYVVRVRGNCSGTLSPESNSEIVGFTTGIACQAPTALSPANLTHNSVDLTWTENGSATKWQICVNGDEENLIDLIASDVTIDGNTITRHMLNLEWETSYTMKVRANCEGEGYSDWSNTVNFTTLVGCGQPTNFTLGTVEAHQASFSWTDGVYNESWDVYVKKHSDASYPTTPNTATTFTPSTTINGLDAETAYDVKIVPNCDENKFLEVPNAFTTAVACPAPTNLAVTDGSITANGATITWDGTADNYIIMVGEEQVALNADFEGNAIPDDFTNDASYPWTVVANTHSGAYCAKSASGNDSQTSALQKEVTLAANATLTFSAKISSENTYDKGYFSIDGDTKINGISGNGNWIDYSYPLTAGTHTLRWYYTKDISDAGNDDCFYLDDIKISAEPSSWDESRTTDQETYTFNNLDAEHSYLVKVKANCGSEGESQPSNAVSFTTAAGCQVPDGLAPSNVTNNSATISWNAYGQTGFNLRYSTDGENWTTENDVTNPYLFNEVLIGNTEYQVQVQVTCNTEEWSDVLNFTTECDHVTTFPWSENFEGFTANTVPTCWDNSASTSYISSSSSSPNCIWGVVTVSGNNMIKMENYWAQIGTALINTPSFEIPTYGTNFVLTFDYAHNASCGEFKVRVSTDNGANFTDLASYTKGSGGSHDDPGTFTTIEPISLGDYAGETIILQFFANANYGNGAIFVDNIKIKEYSVEKTYEPNKWYAIASPVHDIYGSAQTVGDGTTVNLATDPYDLYSYNEVEGSWMNYKSNPFALEMGMGYIYRHGDDNNRTVSYVGAPNSGDINVTITSDCSDDDLKGFNLLGNPYPHEYTLSSAHYTLSTNGCWMSHPSGTIAVAEGFLVSAESDRFDFTENSSKASNSTSAIAFTVSNGEYEDVAYALLENGHGLPKIGHLNSEAPMLSIPVDNRRYAVAMLGEECQGFDMVFRATTGQYTLTVDNGIEGLSYLHLLDRATGRDIDLLREHTYTFNVTASNADRFSVKLSPEAVESTSAHFAYWNGNNWVVEGTGMLQVYDVTGRCLSTLEVDGKLTTDNGNLGISHTGVYVFRMGEKSQKIVVK